MVAAGSDLGGVRRSSRPVRTMPLGAGLSGVRLTGAIRIAPVRADLGGVRRLTGLSLTRPVRASPRSMRLLSGPALITSPHAGLRGMRGLTGLSLIGLSAG